MGQTQGAPVWALGTMSGTSLDGVDACLVRTDGVHIHDIGPGGYRPYSGSERAVLRAALGLWPGDPGVAEAAAVVEDAHAALLAPLLARHPEVRLVGFHGQTLAHDPAGRGTHQAGCGARLAARLGCPVAWDFRTADVAAGGQGAPLAPFYHFACVARAGATVPVAMLNLGGVGNLTWVDPSAPDPGAPGALVAFDTGPANAPLDDLMAARRGGVQDTDGVLAASGRVAEGVLQRLLTAPYLRQPPPKSLDRNDFPDLLPALADLSDADALATATAFSAACVAAGLAHLPQPPARLLVTGGGRHNPTLVTMLAQRCACPVAPVESIGLDGDLLEAQAFAHLAVRVSRGLPLSAPGTTGVPAPCAGGRLSRPAPLPAAPGARAASPSAGQERSRP
ncbi:anhydro-N-acetylmuramic acid kinase [Rhodobaculum claviforme]|uniref:Anhydro-N-acetylmuramic acid kinase n=1 Tax=Rhodobaculum claviforme TaxID=1549854 RepID=A0A934TLB5_9RHOB|nr:anhydro-N-acetylmuramic acid kinase [Rhodobaculum claviforme]MBK5927952.1 anhydro-N-acetylmuramic acid kinase [Rhodobaculum claviforme]